MIPAWYILAALTAMYPTRAQDWLVPVNTSMCNWSGFSAGVIRDNVFLWGGSLWRRFGYSDGSYKTPQNDGNAKGPLFKLPLSEKYDIFTTNLTGLFSRDLQPEDDFRNSQDGAMFATDNEFLLYGGTKLKTDADKPLAPGVLLQYQQYPWGNYNASWSPGFVQPNLPAGMTQYISNGASVSIPSENLGFYFSGMRAPDWGVINTDDGSANTTANTLLKVDLTAMQEMRWSNYSLPSFIDARADAEMVWLPISEQGALVVLGGTAYPASVFPAGLSTSQKDENSLTSPGFMEKVSIYDVANDQWFTQNTTGNVPPQPHALFCAVVASAADGSSHNIYIYGGFDGQDTSRTPYDHVYVLSVPSFTWTLVYNGTQSHGRSGHRCFRIFPDQMLILGGRHRDPTVCLDGGIIQIFNLNTLQFQPKYRPDEWEEYQVPHLVRETIGGSGSGGANYSAPPSWDDKHLGSLFKIPYTKTSTWFPYNTSSSTDTTSPTISSTHNHDQHWNSRFIPAVVIPGTIVCCILLLSYWACSKRRSEAASICYAHHPLGRLLRRVGLNHKCSCVVEIGGSPLAEVLTPATELPTEYHDLSPDSVCATPVSMYPQPPAKEDHGYPDYVVRP